MKNIVEPTNLKRLIQNPLFWSILNIQGSFFIVVLGIYFLRQYNFEMKLTKKNLPISTTRPPEIPPDIPVTSKPISESPTIPTINDNYVIPFEKQFKF